MPKVYIYVQVHVVVVLVNNTIKENTYKMLSLLSYQGKETHSQLQLCWYFYLYTTAEQIPGLCQPMPFPVTSIHYGYMKHDTLLITIQ